MLHVVRRCILCGLLFVAIYATLYALVFESHINTLSGKGPGGTDLLWKFERFPFMMLFPERGYQLSGEYVYSHRALTLAACNAVFWGFIGASIWLVIELSRRRRIQRRDGTSSGHVSQ
jgi:hypothetical protein